MEDRSEVGGRNAALFSRRCRPAARFDADRIYAGEAGRGAALAAAALGALRRRARRVDRQPGGADGAGRSDIHWFAPIVADAEAGFGGALNAFELMKAMIEAGAAAVHFEDQLSSVKKCGHMGGKVLVPLRDFIQKLIAARLAADVMGVPTVIIARTDALSAKLIRAQSDPADHPFFTGELSPE